MRHIDDSAEDVTRIANRNPARPSPQKIALTIQLVFFNGSWSETSLLPGYKIWA
jgi:hypothetical protein